MVRSWFDCRRHCDEVLSDLFTRLWDCDVNRCEPEKDYTIDIQGNITDRVVVLLCSDASLFIYHTQV